MVTGRLFPLLPPALQVRVSGVKYLGLEVLERLRGEAPPDLPPLHLRALFTSSWRPGAFRRSGRKFVDHFVDRCGLQAGERVLEIGCGCGRSALPMADFLTSGQYRGIDISKRGIRWCSENISKRNPRFTFRHADIRNREYNPGGRIAAEDFTFPFPDRSFDFVFLTSVFTHMLPGEVGHYLAEIHRMLAEGGRAFLTFFLWNEESRRLSAEGASKFPFDHDAGECLTTDPAVPERAVCFPEPFVLSLLEEKGFSLKGGPLYGFWPGRVGPAFGQDSITAWKVAG